MDGPLKPDPQTKWRESPADTASAGRYRAVALFLFLIAGAVTLSQESRDPGPSDACPPMPSAEGISTTPMASLLAPILPFIATNRPPEARLCGAHRLSALSGLLAGALRSKDAEYAARKSLEVLDSLVPPDSPARLEPLYVLTVTRLNEGRLREARALLKQLAVLHLEVPLAAAMRHSVTATVLTLESKTKEAIAEYQAALQKVDRLGVQADISGMLLGLTELLLKTGELQQARESLGRVYALLNGRHRAVPIARFNAYYLRACLDLKSRNWEPAATYLEASKAVVTMDFRSEPALLARVLQRQAELFKATGRKKEARETNRAALELWKKSGAGSLVDVTELEGRP
jgi:ATP/maltotriose-dependent transcriptional regulator MalT